MIVVHIESGLGNQMLGYLEYLAIKQENPNENCVIENLVYELGGKQTVINMWNGYELESIFGIKVPNIKQVVDEQTWRCILNDVEKSEFWKFNWAYPEAIVGALSNAGITLENRCVSHGSPIRNTEKNLISLIKKYGKKCCGGIPYSQFFRIKETVQYHLEYKKCDHSSELFPKNLSNVYCGFTLNFSRVGYAIDKLFKMPREIFMFPEFTTEENKSMSEELMGCNSIAIHARRGDLLTFNGIYYKNGYFKRATKLIKNNISNPVFYFFSDPGSVEWCIDNLHIFGLDKRYDKVKFINWNKGIDSYRDMQLMTLCKGNIITNSSFGWWGAYLNSNIDKITVSPGHRILTTHHC